MKEENNKNKKPWFTSDIHVFHKNIIRYSNRPFRDVQHMNDSLVDNINSCVMQDDVLYHLGDLAFTQVDDLIKWINRINCGTVHFILGNHDKTLINNRKRIMEETHNVKSISDYKEINYNGQPIILFHYGMRVWNKSHHGSWHLYGHSHGTLPPHGKSVDVGVDSPWITGKPEYRPFSFSEIERFMRTREISKEDYHAD